MKIIVTYKTKYGSSKQYALWLADALDCQAEQVERIRLNDLLRYDVVIHVGGLYAGRVDGFTRIAKHLDALKNKRLLLCMVGMTNPTEQEKYRQVFMNNVPEPYREAVRPFALRGNQLFSKMSLFHRLMMKVPKAMAQKVPAERRTAEDKAFIENYGKDICFARREAIDEVVAYVKGLQG